MFTGGEEMLFLPRGGLQIEEGLVKEIGDWDDLCLRHPEEEKYDSKGRLILPGMTCVHHHLYSTFARGIALKGEAPRKFGEILERLWWRLDKSLGLEDIYFSALIPLIECLRCGTTAIIDHHASPHAVRGSLEQIARAVKEVGIRSCLCYEVSDRDGPEIAEEGIAENVAFIEGALAEKPPLLSATFGLHASLTLSDRTLEKAREAADKLKVGFHIHAAEGIEDVEDSLCRSNKRVIERLKDFGILGEKTIAAHCIHVNDREIDILQSTGTIVAHNPSSNMNNAVGFAPVDEMLRRGVLVGLGTDGMTSDMFSELRLSFLLMKHATSNPQNGWMQSSTIFFKNNPRILSRLFARKVGELSAGSSADLIVLDYKPPTPMNGENFLGHMFFALSSRHVDSTIVGGRFLMKERRLLFLDEDQIAAKARELAQRLWQRF